jgi:glycosyltransferase involved in cell wall biosynthesis
VQWLAFVESLDHVCCRYRLRAFQPLLAQAGHQLDLRALPLHWWSRCRLFRQARAWDGVILQRKLLDPLQLLLLRRSAQRLIYDLDDAVFLRDSYAAKGPHSARRLRRFAATVRAADAVVAGNAFLANQVMSAARKNHATIVPTCVDPDHYPGARHQRTPGSAQLVWIGSSSTLQGLQAIAPMLEQIGQRWRGLRLKLICDRFFHLERLPVVACPWDADREAEELAAADIGISWLPDDLWSRGKCGLKVLQYMAAGLPVVANPVGVHCELVRHGETGFLVETPHAWLEALGRLAHDPALRRRLGQAGRKCVAAQYSVTAGAQRWLGILGNLQERKAA